MYGCRQGSSVQDDAGCPLEYFCNPATLLLLAEHGRRAAAISHAKRVFKERAGTASGVFPGIPRNHYHPTPCGACGAALQQKECSPMRRHASQFRRCEMDLELVSETSSLRTWVRTSFGDAAVPCADLTVRNTGLEFDSLLLCRGPGSEPGMFDADQFSASRYVVAPDGSVVWGKAPCERAPGEDRGLRLADGQIVWTGSLGQCRGSLPPVPLPTSRCPPRESTSEATANEEAAAIDELRASRLARHPNMRQVLKCLVQTRYGSQAKLAAELGLTPELLAEYNTGKARSKQLSNAQLNTMCRTIDAALIRKSLPRTVEQARGVLAAGACLNPLAPGIPSTACGGATSSEVTTSSGARPSARDPSLRSVGSAKPVPVLILSLSESSGRHGGQVLVMDVGQPRAENEQVDNRWVLNAEGHALQLRLSFRARYTFGARVTVVGGRTFEWWIETLNSHELAHNGGPLFVGREVTSKTECLSAVHAKSDASGRILGRAVGASGSATGHSSPALLWAAVATHFELPKSTLKAPLTICGLTHPKLLELLAIVDRACNNNHPNNSSIGSRSGGLSGLKEGGSRLREIRRLAGEEFALAMERVSPDDPRGAFAELMKSPTFRNEYLPSEWRNGLTFAAIQQQILETPFFSGMVTVYHEIKGWKAKRQCLALVAGYFPVKVAILSPPTPASPT